MPDLLLELLSEEIPARMQRKAAEDLRRLVTDALVDAGLHYEGAKAFVTPRRLALTVTDIPARSAAVREERKGPKVGAPDQAVQGFLKSAGLSSIEEAQIQSDPKKGDFYVAVTEKPGRDTESIIADAMPRIIRNFPWPKSMHWGNGRLNWVRPLQSIVCTFGTEIEDPVVIDFEIEGIRSGNITVGHRFMVPGDIAVRRFDDYVARLESAGVVLDADRRKDLILHDARDRAFAVGLELVEDEGLLEEVAGLVEWPVVLIGTFEEEFLSIPPEVIRATIRANQKCFVVRKPGTSQLANRFILVANIEASDGGDAIAAGNSRVIRARLSDAKFFYDNDLRTRLEDRLPRFDEIVFHEKIGSQAARIARIEELAVRIAPVVGADIEKTRRAARLAKTDLLTEVVGEFPELQGLMGRYYALAQGEDPAVAAAIEEHYKPQGPGDSTPKAPVAVAVALADKLDSLVSFWTIDEKPTSSKDPYALRRAALGVIRILLENRHPIKLHDLIDEADEIRRQAPDAVEPSDPNWREDLLGFFADRLKVQLREQGARHDLVDAVFALDGQDDLLLMARRIEALAKFLDTEDGQNLLAGYRRAANILRAEEKKGETFDGEVDAAYLLQPEERALHIAVRTARANATAAVGREDFEAAMTAIARLRKPVDAFFDKVLVNADQPKVRSNRLHILNSIRAATLAVADFSKVGG